MKIRSAVLAALLAGCANAPETPIETPVETKTEPEPVTLTAEEQEAYDDAVLLAERELAARERERVLAEADAIEEADAIANAKADAFNKAELLRVRRARYQWLQNPASRPYMVWLCSLPSSFETQVKYMNARNTYGIVPKRGEPDDSQEEQEGYAVFDCASFVTK